MSSPLPHPAFISADGGAGTRLAVHVVPRASRTAICGCQGDALKIRLQAPPVDGKANQALCKYVAACLGLPRRDVILVAGATSRQKTLHIPGLPPDEVCRRLQHDEA